MKLLREYIRELLTESVDPKIMSMIDKAEAKGLRAMVKSGYAAVYDPTIDVSKYYDGYVGSVNRVAGVSWDPDPGSANVPCAGARQVSVSGSKDFGMGPLAYDLAIEASGGLMSDRLQVSSDARAVWDYYMNNRSDVEAVQMDDPKNTLTPGEEDNCDQEVAGGPHTSYGGDKDFGSGWIDHPLSKMYRKSGTPVMDELRRRNMLDGDLA